MSKRRRKIVPLGTEVKFLSGGTPKKSMSHYWNGDIPWVSSGEMARYYIHDTSLRVTEEGSKNGTRFVPENTVLIVVRGMSLAKEFRVAMTMRPVTFNQDLKALKPSSRIDPQFLFFYLRSQARAIRDSSTEASHGTKKLETRVIEEWPFPLMDISEQHAISSVLSQYDDLIENNKRRIELLEQSARLLYKEWFVRLRFPGHEHVKIVDGVPNGWIKGTYFDAFEFLGGFAFKSKTYQEGGKYGVVTIKNVHDAHFKGDCTSRIENPPTQMKKHCFLETGDVLLSLTGNVGRACIVYGDDLLLNQRVAKVIGKQGIPRSFVYWTFSNSTTQKRLENMASGVAQLNLSPINLGNSEFMIPSRLIVEMFAEIADSFYKQIGILNQCNKTLADSRNLLLPRLMNGEIAV